MSNTAIIYRSKTGFSARYARWIAKALHGDLYRYKTVDAAFLSSYDTIIYGAGFYGANLSGIGWFKKLVKSLDAQKILIFATGSMPHITPEDLQKEWDMNFTPEEQERFSLFYFPGGMNYARLGIIDQWMMRLFRFYMLHSMHTKDNTRALLMDLRHSVNFTDPRAIKPLLEEARY